MLKTLIYIWLASQIYFTSYYYDVNEPIHFIINITLDRLLLLAILLCHTLSTIQRTTKSIKINNIEYLMLFFGVVCTLSMIFSGANIDSSHGQNRWSSTLVMFIFAPTYFYHLSRQVFLKKEDVEVLLRVFVCITLYLGIVGILEHYRFDRFVYPSYIMNPQMGLHWERARGPFLNSGINGRIIVFGFMCALFLIKNGRRKYRTLLCISTIPMLCTIYFTNTRGVWLGFVAALFVLFFYNKQFRKYTVLVVIVVAVGVFSGSLSKLSLSEKNLFQSRATTIDDRLNLMYAATRMIIERPLFGWGYGQFNFVSPDFFMEIKDVELRGQGEGNHNTMLGLFAEVGLFGFLPYAFTLCLLYLQSKTLIKLKRDTNIFSQDFGVLFISLLVAYIVTMQSGDVRWNMLQNVIIFLFAGIIFSIVDSHNVRSNSNSLKVK